MNYPGFKFKHCIPSVDKEMKRNQITKGKWKKNTDTLFLTANHYYFITEEGLKRAEADTISYRRKHR